MTKTRLAKAKEPPVDRLASEEPKSKKQSRELQALQSSVLKERTEEQKMIEDLQYQVDNLEESNETLRHSLDLRNVQIDINLDSIGYEGYSQADRKILLQRVLAYIKTHPK